MTMKDYSEKRDFHRMQVDAEIQITDSNGQTLTAICRDLSGTGMQLYVDRPFNEGDEIHTLMLSTTDQIPPFETVSEIVRCTPEGDGYLLGTAIVTVKR